ncbi:MAG: hypothetical protein ACRBM6_01485 [Geminicoccales bacterium]
MKPAFALTLLSIVLGLLLNPSTQAQDTQTVPEKPELTVRMIPPEPYLQEQIVQTVRVISANVFEELVLDLPPVDGADVITMQAPKTRKFSTYGGEGYIYETRRAIFPKASGELVIPPVRVSGSVAISRDERESFALKQSATSLQIKPPPEAFSGPSWLVARRIEIEETWSKPVDELKVGDHVTRTINVEATGVTGGHLTELDHGRSTGITILPSLTERSTEITPNEVIGKMHRSFEIRIDTDQPINISPVRVVWWNTDTEVEFRSAAQSIRIEPLPRDVEGLVQRLMTEAVDAHTTGRYGITAMVMISCVGLLFLLGWFLLARRRSLPEDHALLAMVRANPNALSVSKALLIWGEAILPEEKPMSLERLGQYLGSDAPNHLSRLQQAAFGREGQRIDLVDVTEILIGIARDQRQRSLTDIVAGVSQHLLGPRHHLPSIQGRTIKR